MNYVEFKAGEQTYKLRLDTKSLILLERSLKKNPISIIQDCLVKVNGKVEFVPPTVTVMTNILHAALQPFHQGTSPEKTYEIFDAWIDDGHQVSDFENVILELYYNGGLLSKGSKAKN